MCLNILCSIPFSFYFSPGWVFVSTRLAYIATFELIIWSTYCNFRLCSVFEPAIQWLTKYLHCDIQEAPQLNMLKTELWKPLLLSDSVIAEFLEAQVSKLLDNTVEIIQTLSLWFFHSNVMRRRYWLKINFYFVTTQRLLMFGNVKLFPIILRNIKLYKHYPEKNMYIHTNLTKGRALYQMSKLNSNTWESKQNKSVPSFTPYSSVFQIGGKYTQNKL